MCIRDRDICVRYQIPIISDEIHSDLMLYGHRHTVMAGVSGEIADITITCTSATKTFNLAGLQAATPVSYTHLDVYKRQLFKNPLHPYTQALLDSIPVPRLQGRNRKRQSIKGEIVSPIDPAPGLSLIHI